MKYSEVNLTEEIQNLHSENYKIPLKEKKEDLHKWKTPHVQGLRGLRLLRWQYPLNRSLESR